MGGKSEGEKGGGNIVRVKRKHLYNNILTFQGNAQVVWRQSSG